MLDVKGLDSFGHSDDDSTVVVGLHEGICWRMRTMPLVRREDDWDEQRKLYADESEGNIVVMPATGLRHRPVEVVQLDQFFDPLSL
jgi:hypothetical protein